MKKFYLICSILFVYQTINATEWFTYFVYFEDEYSLGYWTRADELYDKSNGKFLNIKSKFELFGSSKEEIIIKVLENLKELKPEKYNWECKYIIKGDSIVIIEADKDLKKDETISNEMIASLVLNSFNAVSFKYKNDIVT